MHIVMGLSDTISGFMILKTVCSDIECVINIGQ